MKKSNFEIVLKYLRTFEGKQTVTLPDGYKYGWNDNKLCMILSFSELLDDGWGPETDEWHITDMSLNYFVNQCDLLTEEDIMGMVFSLGMNKEKK